MRSRNLLLVGLLSLGAIIAVSISCSKDDVEDTTECIAESLFASIHHTADANNPKLITWSVDYTGDDHSVSKVDWTFGDGKKETSQGTSITHTYEAAGTYEVKAVIHLSGLDCSFDKTKSITVQ